MASATDLFQLDRLGAVLEQLGYDQIALSIAREDGRTFSYADVAGPSGKFECAMGASLAEAFTAAEVKLANAWRVRAVAHA